MNSTDDGRRTTDDGRAAGSEQRAEGGRWQARLLTVFTVEQLEQLAELMQVTHDQAVIRKTRQTLTVVFNEKGHPREFNGSNNVIPAKTYVPE